jgi:hypothetical protein
MIGQYLGSRVLALADINDRQLAVETCKLLGSILCWWKLVVCDGEVMLSLSVTEHCTMKTYGAVDI